MRTGDVADFVDQLKNGGWEFFEAGDDKITKAVQPRVQGLTAEDMREIETAWAEFANSPSGHKALQALIDRTILRDFFPIQFGLSAEQAAIHAAYRQGQNFMVQLILNQVRRAREEAEKQRDTT